MKKLLKYLKNYRKECIIAPSFKMLEALFELFVPLVMTKIIDEGITGKNLPLIYRNGALLILLGIIGLTCSLIAQYFAAKAAIGFAKGVRQSLFKKIINFSNENLDKAGTSTLITRMTGDLNTVQNGVNMVLRLLLRSPFIVFGAMIMAFTINVKAALIFVIMIPILFVTVFTITLVTIPRYKKIQKELDKLTSHIRENLSGVRVVRAFSQGPREKEAFTEDNKIMYRLNLVTSRISALLNPITLIVVNLSMLILIYNGASLVKGGILTSGQVYALVNYMSQILIELVKLANLIITINKSLASASRISDTLSIEETLENNGICDAYSLSSDNLLTLDNVSFKYPGAGDLSLKNITMSMKKGETIGIIGGTGSGKSTLASLILRFYDVTEGSIKYMDSPLPDIELKSLRKIISIVPQKAELFSGTLKDNLLLANPDATEETMNEAVRLSVSEDIVSKKGEGLNFEILEGGANLSGGQKQRLTIARALVADASLLILDDSASALDYVTDRKLRENLKSLKDKLSVIIISQRISAVKDADRILVLDDGSMCGFDTHEKLLNSSTVYREIYNSQMKAEETL